MFSNDDDNDGRPSLDYDSDAFDINPVDSEEEEDNYISGDLFTGGSPEAEALSYKSTTPPRPVPREQRLRVKPKVPPDSVKNIIWFEHMGIYGTMFLLYLMATILMAMGQYDWLPMVDGWFGVYIFLFFSIFFIVSLIGGWLVKERGIDVMYTRKTIHFFSFFLPFTLFHIIPFDKTLTSYSLTCCALFLAYVPLMEQFRVNEGIWRIFYYAFISFDRPEDPFTLLWAVSQSFCAFVVMLPISVILDTELGAKEFTAICIMTVACGDGFAEIVGKNWGDHKFKTNAMCTQKEYTRSIEGCLCVFLSCLVTILIVSILLAPGVWNIWQILLACLTLPISMTVTEAIAPHSWDNALLLLNGGMGTIIIFFCG